MVGKIDVAVITNEAEYTEFCAFCELMRYNVAKDNSLKSIPLSYLRSFYQTEQVHLFIRDNIVRMPHPEHITCPYGELVRLSVDDYLTKAGFTKAANKPQVCQECKGTGQYIGLFAIEPCRCCGGKGR